MIMAPDYCGEKEMTQKYHFGGQLHQKQDPTGSIGVTKLVEVI